MIFGEMKFDETRRFFRFPFVSRMTKADRSIVKGRVAINENKSSISRTNCNFQLKKMSSNKNNLSTLKPF
jgi:hypothetical protein